jgi:uncharacterized protein (TIGR02996 family)
MHELLREIYARPADDGPRLVYADHLLQAGDPRGEFIALQCGRKKGARGLAREKELLDAHLDEWAGAFGSCVSVNRRVIFRRGFPAEVGIFRADGLIGAPEWSTIEKVWISRFCLVEVLSVPSVFPALASIGGLDGQLVAELRKVVLPSVREIELATYHTSPSADELLTVFPGLARLEIAGTANSAKLAPYTDGKIAELVTHANPAELHQRIGWGLELVTSSQVQAFICVSSEWTLRYVRRPGGIALEAKSKPRFRQVIQRAASEMPFVSVTVA